MIKLNSKEIIPYKTECAYVIVYETEAGSVDVSLSGEIKSVRPLSIGVDKANDFSVAAGQKVIIEQEGDLPIFLFTYKAEKVNPADYTYYFEPGEHYIDELHLKDGESIYAAGGAVLKMHVRADKASNLKIAGRGIFDTSEIGSKKRRQLRFIEGRNIELCDITLVGAIDWAIVPIACENVSVSGVNVISWEVNGDGIDVVGCKDVTVRDSFFHCADDCLCVKANDYDDDRGNTNCENVLFERCILWNTRPGNAMEVGFETRCEEIKNVTFRDIDVLHCEYEGWMSGGVFTIHNGDRANIHHINYENIRVENAEQKLFDLKVLHARYSKDKERGYISDITARGIYVNGKLPPSIFADCTNSCRLKNIVISGLYNNDKKVSDKLSAHFISENGSEVIFKD
jgi:polygalacturonase